MDAFDRWMSDQGMTAEQIVAARADDDPSERSAYCDQGHPPHDPTFGCGPCADEQDAGMGARIYALPRTRG